MQLSADPKSKHCLIKFFLYSIPAHSYQIEYIVKALQTQYKDSINFEEDWKLMTIFIGANNLCGVCKNETYSTPEWFEMHLRNALQLVKKSIPRVFVNLITIFNISGISFLLLLSSSFQIKI